MIDGLFLLRLALSFVVGGIYIAALTRISEHLGPKIGGVVSTLPSTGLVGMVFLGVSEGIGALPPAAPAMVAGFGTSLIFLMLYTFLRQKNISAGAAAALATAAWIIIMTMIGLHGVGSITAGFAWFLACFIAAALFFRPVHEANAPKKAVSTLVLLSRAVFAGSIVAGTVLLAHLISPAWGGVAAAFPALYVSSIIILERQQGKDFTLAVIKHLSFGSFSLALFGISIEFTSRRYPLALTIILSAAVSAVFAVCLLAYRTRPAR